MKTDNAQLAAFSAVLRSGSFEAAAQALHVTPSAVSQRIRLLEERMGQVLLQRTTPCRATPAGKVLARFAEQVALLEAEVLREVGAAPSEGTARLRMPVAVNADSLDSWFLDVCEAMLASLPAELDLRVEDQDHSATLLREGVVMAAVSARPAPIQGCSVEPIGVMRYRAVATPAFVRQHFAAGVDVASLSLAPMLTFNRKDELQSRFLQQLVAQTVQPPTHFVPSTIGFLAMARRGVAWGMIPENFLGEVVDRRELVDISPGQCLDVPLYWHRWRIASPVLDRLSREVRVAAMRALGSGDRAAIVER